MKVSNNYLIMQYLISLIFVLFGIYLWKKMSGLLIHFIKKIKEVKKFPGPSAISMLKIMWKFMTNVEESFNLLMKTSERYELFPVWFGPKVIVVTSRPNDFEIGLSSTNSAQKSFFYKMMEPVVINSLMNGHGPKMRANRKLLIPLINGKYLKNYIENFNKHCHHGTDSLAKYIDMNEFDIYNETEHIVEDIIHETLFGLTVSTKKTGDMTVGKAMEFGLNSLYERWITPWLYPTFFFNLSKPGKIFKSSADFVYKFLNEIINSKEKLYTALMHNDSSVKKPSASILDLFIEQAVKTNTMNVDEIRYNFLALFIGSYDSILGTFSFAMLMIAMHHEVQEKVREEVISVIGRDGDVSLDDSTKLTYTEMVVKETIRLFPVGPLLTREVSEDIELDNCNIPKGSTLVMIPAAAHRSKKYWNEPDKFIPERFSPENSINRHPYAYVPFSAGTRSCPGMKYGITCLKIMIAHYIRKYQFTTTMKLEKLELKMQISVRSRNGYNLSIKKLERL